MMTLELIAAPLFALDLSSLIPERLTGLTVEQIKRLPLAQGRRAESVGDLFKLRGKPSDVIEILGVTPHCHRLGARMQSGQLIARGTCGDELGREMRGGTLSLDGNAGDCVGMGMRNGLLEINGRAGDFVGGPVPGATSGMRGGAIVITREVGARVGDRMRRGLIVVGGDAGVAAASQLIAGTLVVLGAFGAGYASGMRRGTLLARASEQAVPANFVLTGTFELPFVSVLAAYVSKMKPAFRSRLRAFAKVERWVGDRGCGGLGELLIARAAR